nr:PREDICTED: proline-rich protein PRCC-like [Raphanus sativus]
MDSLVASYASSDEEEEPQPPTQSLTVKSSSSSLFSAIPQPNQSRSEAFDSSSSSTRGKSSSSSFLSSLPPPKSRQQNPSPSLPKRVVQIKLPVNPNLDDDEDDEEEEEKARKKRRQMEAAAAASNNSSVKSFLSAMPAPKSSQALGALPSLGSGSGTGRRSILETETPAITQSTDQTQSFSSSETEQVDNYYAGYGGYEQNPNVSGYVGYDSYGGGGNAWNGGGGFEGTRGVPEAFIAMDSGARRGRRGRNDFPTEIVEVKQDELMKNRPRVDQVKSTGIAFGPTYQPESSSSKGKVSKLHKRKHQITALFMDMKHKESELAERRSKGLLTKAETQAKYGW